MAKQTTGKGLNADDAFLGLVDYGLFSEKLPPCFLSEGLSGHATPAMNRIFTEEDVEKLRNRLKKFVHSQIRYQALRETNTPRQLSVPHPESYLAHCLVLKRTWRKVKRHCAKPSISASRIYVQKTKENRLFRMSYKGRDRFALEEDEIRMRSGATHVVNADISKCFPSIYTHSIPWAIHGKTVAKKRREDLALEGNLIDRACQVLSDNQTNGIAIGPHASNVVSELILTRVDDMLQGKGFTKFLRNIDDYTFYANSNQQSEAFVRELTLALRQFELYLNDKKTTIQTIPRPTYVRWVNELRNFNFNKGTVRYSEVRSFLDLALALAASVGSSVVLNYAIKVVPTRLNDRAKRLFTAEAIGLCLAHPYLAPLMLDHVFEKHRHSTTNYQIAELVNSLIRIGISKIYPESIAYSLYYAIKFDIFIDIEEGELGRVVALDDCLANVLLWDYAQTHGLSNVTKMLKTRSKNLKLVSKADQDSQWMFIYHTWIESDMRGLGQTFLADLKKSNFNFVRY